MLPQGEGYVVEYAQIGKQGAELEQHAHASAGKIKRFLAHLTDLLAVKKH